MSRRSHHTAPTSAAMAVAALLAACGGSDTTPAATPVPQLAAATSAVFAGDCASLQTTLAGLANTTITAAITVPAGTVTSNGPTVAEHCRVTGKITLDGMDIYDPSIDVVELRARVGRETTLEEIFLDLVGRRKGPGERTLPRAIGRERHALQRLRRPAGDVHRPVRQPPPQKIERGHARECDQRYQNTHAGVLAGTVAARMAFQGPIVPNRFNWVFLVGSALHAGDGLPGDLVTAEQDRFLPVVGVRPRWLPLRQGRHRQRGDRRHGLPPARHGHRHRH